VASVALAMPVEKRASTSYSGGTTANDVTNGGDKLSLVLFR